MSGRLTLQRKCIFKCLKGKVFGDWLVTGPQTRYHLKGHNMYDGKEGYFKVFDGFVYGYVPAKDIFCTKKLES